ncbi:MAG: DUF6261 family protein [Bacteroidetes bacterium]|nr:DUF6261 family protein [Bacteroidota bacterium]
MTGMDTDRDQRFSEIKSVISTALKSHDAGTKATAGNLKLFFDLYWNDDKKPQDAKSGAFSGMFREFNANAELKAQGVVIGITTLMSENHESHGEKFFGWAISMPERVGDPFHHVAILFYSRPFVPYLTAQGRFSGPCYYRGFVPDRTGGLA